MNKQELDGLFRGLAIAGALSSPVTLPATILASEKENQSVKPVYFHEALNGEIDQTAFQMAGVTQEISRQAEPELKQLGFDPNSAGFRLATEWQVFRTAEQRLIPSLKSFLVVQPDGLENEIGIHFVRQETETEKAMLGLVITGNLDLNDQADSSNSFRLQKAANEIGGFDLVGVDNTGNIGLRVDGAFSPDGNFQGGDVLLWDDQAGSFLPCYPSEVDLTQGVLAGASLERETLLIEEAKDNQPGAENQYRLESLDHQSSSFSLASITVEDLPVFEVKKQTVEVTAKTSLRVRSGPGVEYSALGSLEPGQTVEVIGKDPTTGWLEIVFLDKDGKPCDFAFVSGATEENGLKYLDLVNGSLDKVADIAPEDLPQPPQPKPTEQPQTPQPVEQQPSVTESGGSKNLSPEEIEAIQRGEKGFDAYVQLLMPRFNVKEPTSRYINTNTFDPYTGLTDNEIDFIVGSLGKYFDVFSPDEKQALFLPKMIGLSRSAGGVGDLAFLGFGRETLGQSNEHNYSDEVREMLVCVVVRHETTHCKQELEGKMFSEKEAYLASADMAERLVPRGFPQNYVDYYYRRSQEESF